jgi:protein arginine N-methyltransferase 1
MYSLDQFASMFSDRLRMDAYTAAIARAVRPGDSVVDLGCGPGIFALLACKAGARRVYAIDLNAVVDFGRHLAAVNGCSDKIQFLKGDSRQIHLPERVDVVVADLRGVLPLHSHSVDTLHDARDRFLAEGGRFLPSRDTLVAAIVTLPEHYEQLTHAWKAVPGLELSSGLPIVLNTIYRHQLKPHNVISQPRPWHVLDYSTGASVAAHARLEMPILRHASGHGVAIWFETSLMDGIGYSTEPQNGDTVYGHLFLPWLEPVALQAGDVCTVDVGAHLVGNDYIWQWNTMIPVAHGRNEINFQQSTFYGSLFPSSLLQKRTMDFVPVLSEVGLAERWLFQAMDGKRSLEDIAAEAARLFPHVYRRSEDAFRQAAEIAEKFSR